MLKALVFVNSLKSAVLSQAILVSHITHPPAPPPYGEAAVGLAVRFLFIFKFCIAWPLPPVISVGMCATGGSDCPKIINHNILGTSTGCVTECRCIVPEHCYVLLHSVDQSEPVAHP